MKVTVTNKHEDLPAVRDLPDGAAFTKLPDGSVFIKVRRPKARSAHINELLAGRSTDTVAVVSLRQGNLVLLQGSERVFPVDAEVVVASKHGTPQEGH